MLGVKTYYSYFDATGVVVPLMHAQIKMEIFVTLGTIISHGYLTSGYLPIRIALPTLICILLGPAADIPKQILVEAFLDHLSEIERESIKGAIKQRKLGYFTKECREEMLSILSYHGCIDMPTPDNLIELIVKVAKFQFCLKSTASVIAMHTGIPPEHKRFWETQGVQGIQQLYLSLSLSRQKILSLIHCQCKSPAEERVYGYLRSMIGNMNIKDLANLLRFATGSSVAIASSIEVTFNFTSGYSRSPFGRTCGNTLELPLEYNNYDDFHNEWMHILSNTNDEWKWRMDFC